MQMKVFYANTRKISLIFSLPLGDITLRNIGRFIFYNSDKGRNLDGQTALRDGGYYAAYPARRSEGSATQYDNDRISRLI